MFVASRQGIGGLQVVSKKLEGMTKIQFLYSDCNCSDQHYKRLFEGSSSNAFNELPVKIQSQTTVCLEIMKKQHSFSLMRKI